MNSWVTASDQDILDDITAAQLTIEDAGFDASHICLNTAQYNRISQFEWVINSKMLAKDYIKEVWDMELVRTKKVSYKDKDGNAVVLFTPVDEILVFDKPAYAVFSQRATSIELERVGSRGVDLAYMRKFFKTKAVQTDAAYVIDGTVI